MVDLQADATIHLLLQADINSNLPSVSTELFANWGFQVFNSANGIEVTFNQPLVELRDVTLDLGDFLTRIAGNTLKQVDEKIEPIKPVVKFLKQEVPGLSELSKLSGNGPVTFLDLAFINDRAGGEQAKKFLNVVDKIITLIDKLAAFDEGDNVMINFGTVTLGGGGASGGIDLRNPDWNNDDGSLDSILTGNDVFAPEPMDPKQQANASGNADVAGSLQSLEREPDSKGLGGLGISIDILKPANVIKLLIGQRANIVTWELPIFEVGLDLEKSFRPIAVVPPFKVTLGFELGVFADLSVGYDTRGVETKNFFDGFFFGDRENVNVGADVDEFGFSIGASLAASLDIGVAEGGIEGALEANVLANWRDLDNDGKLYFDEIAQIVRQDGLQCVFDIRGEMRAIVDVFWKVLGKEGSKEIVNKLIFEFMNECPKYELGHVSDGGESLPDGTTSLAGDLIVHSGFAAGKRQPGVTTDVAEELVITELAPGVVEIDGMGLTGRYSGVSRIFADGGQGNDSLTVVSSNIPAVLFGGFGDDELIGGDADDLLDGGPGRDELRGGVGNDTLIGGAGDDNRVLGLVGGPGIDTIHGDAGNDLINGGSEGDNIDGGTGNDTIVGGDGVDTILGGSGNDNIQGNASGDIIDGGAGNDTITGDGGADTIMGGPGRDLIFGNGGADVIHGGSGFDTIEGNAGNDQLFGDDGHDSLVGHAGSDLIVGGNDNDLLIGDEGQDELYGGYGNDVLLAYLPGNVTDPANASHIIQGGPDDDFICGTDAGDVIHGGVNEAGRAYIPTAANAPGSPLAGGFVIVSCVDPTVPPLQEPPQGSILGRKFEDIDGDGDGSGEPGLGGWTIELLDSDGAVVDTTLTASDGTYSFVNVDAGRYVVQEVQQSGYLQTAPALLNYELTVDSNGTLNHTNIDFGNRGLASVHGLKWNDLNGDGIRDEDEPGLANVMIFADANGNGQFDSGEAMAVTMADDPLTEDEDETGHYWLSDLLPGSYVILEVAPSDTAQTYPVRDVLYANNFEVLNVGQEWSSLSDPGSQMISRTPLGQRGFLGPFADADAVQLELSDLPSHTQVTVSFDLFVIGSWDGNDLTEGDDRWKFDAAGVGTLLDTTFSNVSNYLGNTYNQSYPDMTGGGNHPPRTGSSEVNTLGYDAADPARLPGDSQFVAMDAVYRLSFTFAHATTDLTLDFVALLEDQLGDDFEEWGLDNIVVSVPIVGHAVELQSGDRLEGRDFGNKRQTGSIHGTKWEDIDGDGQRGVLEAGLPGVTIYADLNNNGVWDEFQGQMEPHAVTAQGLPGDANSDGFVDVSDFNIWNSNKFQTGTHWGSADFNGDGSTDVSDFNVWNSNKFTSGIPRGAYWLEDIPTGTVVVREVVPPGQIQTFPAMGAPHTVMLNANEVLVGFDFGNADEPPMPEVTLWYESFEGIVKIDTGGLAVDDVTLLSGSSQFFVGVATFPPGVTGTTDTPGEVSFVGGNLVGMHDFGRILPPFIPEPDLLADLVFEFSLVGDPQNFLGTIVHHEGPPGGAPPLENVPVAYYNPATLEAKVDTAGTTVLRADLFSPVVVFNPGIAVFPAQATSTTDNPGQVGFTAAGGYSGFHNFGPVVVPGFSCSEFKQIVTFQYIDEFDMTMTGEILCESPGQIHGLKWEDLDGDGLLDGNEPGLPGVEIYADLNNNGIFDGEDIVAITDEGVPGDANNDGIVDLADFQVVAANFGLVGPNLTIADGNFNGDTVVDALDLNIVQANLFAEGPRRGEYWLTNVPVGNVTVRELVPNGYTQSFPALNAPHIVPVDFGQIVTGIDFGNEPEPAEIHGQKWNDSMGPLGSRDVDEPGVGGVTIYLDFNNNGQLDTASEPSTVTMFDDPNTSEDELGHFWFTDLAPGFYTVREVLPDGFAQSFPAAGGAHMVPLAAGEIVEGIDFGNFEYELIPDGDDEIYAAAGNDMIHGDNEVTDPRVITNGGQDQIYGQGGGDTIFGQEENDILWGDDPNATAGVDTIDGGIGIDRVLQTVDNHQTLTPTLLTGQGPDALTSVERATLTGGPSGSAGNPQQIIATTFGGPVILIGLGGVDLLDGSAFDDTLIGGPGSDQMRGRGGNDTYVFEDDALSGGETDDINSDASGTDTLDFSSLTQFSPVTANLAAALTIASHNTRIINRSDSSVLENVWGGAGDDNITGNSVANVLRGGAGRDELDGAAGNDRLEGGAGDDDRINGLVGGAGNDTLLGGTGNDRLAGGNDNDTFVVDATWGTAGAETDTITDSGGTDTVDLTALFAALQITIGAVNLSGSLQVTDGTNTLLHNFASIEKILSGAGDDVVAFVDQAVLAAGLGTIHAGLGRNTLDYSAYTTPVAVNLLNQTATGTNSVMGVQAFADVLGGQHNDNITGDNGPNVLTGNAGNDSLVGLAGNDVLDGGSGDDPLLSGGAGMDILLGGLGSDLLDGGDDDDRYVFVDPNVGQNENDSITESTLSTGGTDTLDFSAVTYNVTVNLTSQTSLASHTDRTLQTVNVGDPLLFENVTTGVGDDTIIDNDAANLLEGGAGSDVYRFVDTTTVQADTIVELPGGPLDKDDTLDFSLLGFGVVVRLDKDHLVETDLVNLYRTISTDSTGAFINLENITGTAHNDTLVGNDAENWLIGLGGNDELHGGIRNDVLDGGTGDDMLFGGKQDDTLIGGSGTNTLAGGGNDDTYVFTPGVIATDTLIEDASQVIQGLSVVGGSDTLDFSGLAVPVTIDLSSTALQTVAVGLQVQLDDSTTAFSSDHFENVLGSATASNTLTGNLADNRLTGGAGTDNLSGGLGNDTLDGLAGNDQLFGDAGKDTLIYDLADTVSVDGGTGDDTLRFVTPTSGTLLLSAATQLISFEVFDLLDTSVQQLQMSETDVLNLSDTNQLKIVGGTEDAVTLTGGVITWPGPTTVVEDGRTFDQYLSTGGATVLIEQSISGTVSAAPPVNTQNPILTFIGSESSDRRIAAALEQRRIDELFEADDFDDRMEPDASDLLLTYVSDRFALANLHGLAENSRGQRTTVQGRDLAEQLANHDLSWSESWDAVDRHFAGKM